jgi:hypothetical protein
MPPPDADLDLAPDGDGARGSRGRVRHRLSAGRRLARIAYRDPEHVAERLTLFGSQQLGGPALEWATRVRHERPDAPRALIAEEVRIETARIARIDGAVSGTPFLIALVPGYLAYLWQEGRMERHIAALYGHDPRELETCANVLVLRGVHPTVEAAREALLTVRDAALPEKPTKRRPLRVWVRSIYALLVFGGFLSGHSSARDKYSHWRLKAAFGALAGGTIWVITWVLPVSFMIAMAWACESHARSLGRRTLSFYGGESASTEAAIAAADQNEEQGRTKRELLRGFLLVLSVAVPIAFVVYADYVRQSTGINWLGALGALVAASLVIATSVVASRR